MHEIVTLHHNEPMTTSLAIAEGVDLQHKNVLELVRKYAQELSEFGGVAFETRPFETDGGKQWRDVAFLNEQQSTFLVTLMRNSAVVVAFKKSLVRAFYELRAKASTPALQRFSDPSLLIPSHEADKIVASDRVFRAALRSAKAVGVPAYEAHESARKVALQITGVDIAGLVGKAQAENRPKPASIGLDEYAALWVAGERPPPYSMETDWWEIRNDYLKWATEARFAVVSEDAFRDRIWREFWPLRKLEIEARRNKPKD